MTRQTFMSVAAAVSVVSGLAALLAPAQLAPVYGITLDDMGILLTRLLGGAYLGSAATVWFAKDVRDNAARRAIALGTFVSWAIALVVTTAGVLTGLAGNLSWLLVALEVAFATAWGYVAFVDRVEVAST